MMLKEESFYGSDSVKINARAIASIAYLAATEIEGVKRIARDFRTTLEEFIGHKGHAGIRVKLDKNNEVRIKISLIMKYGYDIPDVATKVQENVYRAIEKMAGITVKDIDINVRGVEK
ncbi:MAG: Asp23/Gls24 family envelope stress response protein [Candidatus Omnitrophica bacterium]|nr:Asp23/Gls24 family envelope stress response protein [Candidatus Omnitrophota bacterium]